MNAQRQVRLFRNGRNQAVRIPVEFELPGYEVIRLRDGERLVIEPVRKRALVVLLKSMKPLDEDFPEIEDPADAEAPVVMRYVLDTDVISSLIENPQGKAAKRIASAAEDAICSSIVDCG